jgi:hypothetical protein
VDTLQSNACGIVPNSPLLELTVTEWPHSGGPKVIAGPWNFRPPLGGYYTEPIPCTKDFPADQILVAINDLHPAQPGWLAARVELRTAAGFVLGRERPCIVYAEPNDVGSHVHFSELHNDAAYTLQIRAVR